MKFIARFILRRIYRRRENLAAIYAELQRRHASREHVRQELRRATLRALKWEAWL